MKKNYIALWALLGAVGSGTALEAQLIPRIHRTRPSVTCQIPDSNYQFHDRSRSVSSLSNEFVFMDELAGLQTPGTSPAYRQQSTTRTKAEFKTDGTVVPLDDAKNLARAKPTDIARIVAGLPEFTLEKTTMKVTGSTDESTTVTHSGSNFPSAATGNRQNIKLFQWPIDNLKIDHCEVSGMAVVMNRDGNWSLSLRADQNRRTTENAGKFNPVLHIKRNRFSVQVRCYGAASASNVRRPVTTGKPMVAILRVEDFWVENGQPRTLMFQASDLKIHQHFDQIDHVEIEFFYYR